MTGIKIYTIGFTQTSAEEFFGKLIKAGVRKIVDARLNNTSQLAGFAKKEGYRKGIGSDLLIDIPGSLRQQQCD